MEVVADHHCEPTICQFGEYGEIKPWRTFPNSEANARLIAAAPNLFDACRLAEECLIDLAPYDPAVAAGVVAIIDIVHAAIEKAEGAQ